MASVSIHDALLRVLNEPGSSLVMIAVAAELLATDATFSLWFGRVVKGDPNRSDDTVLELLDEYDQIHMSCIEACASVPSMAPSERERVLVPKLRQLTNSLRRRMGDVDPTKIP
jgi:hypothetical protein